MKCKFAAVLLSLAGAAEAEPIVVTATRTSSQAGPGSVAVVTRDAIEALQPITVLEALDRLAGVRAFQKGGEGGSSYLSVRGGEPNFTLVLLDGVKVGDPTNSQGGAFNFGQIDPAAFETIEVARGGLSAVHGADALSGVVNLRLRSTARGEDFGSIRLHADSRGRVGGDMTAGLGGTDGSLLLSGSAYDGGVASDESNLDRRHLLVKGTQQVSDWAVSGLALHARSELLQFPEDSGGSRLAVLRDLETGSARLSIVSAGIGRSASATLRPQFRLNWSRQDGATDNPGIAPGLLDGVPPIVADTRFDRAEAVADIVWEPVEKLGLAVGGAMLDERGRSRGTIDFGALIPTAFRIDRQLVSGFAEARVGSAARITAGLRHDNPSSDQGRWTARVAGQIPLGPLVVTAAWSQGFKLPSLFALAFPLIANPALRPERSNSLEAGVTHRWTGGYGRIGYFRNRFSDLIDFDPALFTNVNRSRVLTEGIELEAQMTAGRWTADGSLTYLDVNSATPLRFRPRWQGAGRLGWRANDRLTIDAASRFNTSFADSSVPTGPLRASGHVEVDFGARIKMTELVMFSIVARNLLDADYENSVGVSGEGRTVRASLSARF